MNRHALLICNGDPPSRALAKRLARKATVILAADGGANKARKLGISPHVIIGDLDSITPATRKYFASSNIVHVRRQDNTDLEKALDYLVDAKTRQVTIIGATGGRLDFTLGNLSSMWRYTKRLDLAFEGDGWKAMPVGGKRIVRARRGTTVSFVPFGACSGVTLRGVQYTLTNASLRVGDIAVSNVVTHSPFTVSVKKGNLLLIMITPRPR